MAAAEKMLDITDLFGIEKNQNSERRMLSPSYWIDSRDQMSNPKKIRDPLLYVVTP